MLTDIFNKKCMSRKFVWEVCIIVEILNSLYESLTYGVNLWKCIYVLSVMMVIVLVV
jgi:hypothetical protein